MRQNMKQLFEELDTQRGERQAQARMNRRKQSASRKGNAAILISHMVPDMDGRELLHGIVL